MIVHSSNKGETWKYKANKDNRRKNEANRHKLKMRNFLLDYLLNQIMIYTDCYFMKSSLD